MKDLNFIKNNWKRHILNLWIADISFVISIAFLLMYLFGLSISAYDSDNVKYKNHIASKVAEINARSSGYSKLKKQKEELIESARDFAMLQIYQYRTLIGFENISDAIVDNLYISYVSLTEGDGDKTGNVKMTGITTNLEQLSVFIKNLETEFPGGVIKLGSLGAESNGQRTFNITIDFINSNDGVHL